ncbi:MarR family transcriptional regulator [Frankia sp. Cppng1_Ct_nod]|uniref:MarR family winged helix-turn-helix transcriptional regulator n=1 Tax=Frankia sp. Cppng1_Ct_nod TaxID=2897162 RepID=UPI0010416EEB|nr:MarR family transcriptional regulator [Frankia sp. Cppng1_Ct_nod]
MADSSGVDPVAARQLRLAVGRLARRIRRLFVDGGEGLAFLELGILDRLDRSGPTSPGALSEGEGVTGPAIAETLRHLERLGLVERTKDPSDGRRVVVTITDDGRRSLGDRDAVVLERIHEVLQSQLNDTERAHLVTTIHLLEKVAAEL